MFQKVQEYVPAVHPGVAIPLFCLGTAGFMVILTMASNVFAFTIVCALYFAYSFVFVSSLTKHQDKHALGNSRTKEIEPPSRFSADQVSTVKWACQVWHEETTLRQPLELSWSQLYDLADDMGKTEFLRLGLKSIHKDMVRVSDDATVDVSNPNRYPVSHDYAVELRNREASKWRVDSHREYRKFRNDYDEGVVEAIVDDSAINGAYTLLTDYPDALTVQEVDDMRSRVTDRVQAIVDEYKRTRREGAKAYMDTIFKEE